MAWYGTAATNFPFFTAYTRLIDINTLPPLYTISYRYGSTHHHWLLVAYVKTSFQSAAVWPDELAAMPWEQLKSTKKRSTLINQLTFCTLAGSSVRARGLNWAQVVGPRLRNLNEQLTSTHFLLVSKSWLVDSGMQQLWGSTTVISILESSSHYLLMMYIVHFLRLLLSSR